MEDKVKIVNMPALWSMGFLFTLGYILAPLSELLAESPWWEILLAGVMTYILWPFLLGYSVASGGIIP